MGDPARLAAMDQRLAEINDRLDRHHRAIRQADVFLLGGGLVAIIYLLAARPAIGYWDAVIPWAMVALAAAGSLYQGRMFRGYRAEIRRLRAQVEARDG